MGSKEDATLANAAKGVRKAVNEMKGAEESDDEETIEKKKKTTKGGGVGRKNMAKTPTSISSSVLKKAVNHYNQELKQYLTVANYELGLRAAFQNLLNEVAKHVGWSLVPEMTIGKIRPDGVLIDEFKIRRGYWEAKGPATNLEDEISKKIKTGYPLVNTIFEDTNKAVLYQGKTRFSVDFDLRNTNAVTDLLQYFFTYVEPDIENFEEAVDEFKERIPENAQGLVNIIKEEHKLNKKFQVAFATFAEVCRTSLDPKMNDAAIDEMLVQHLLTERLFRTVFNNPDFVNNNIIAAEIEKVVRALASRSFNRNDFLKTLDRFYVAIEKAAKGIESWSERQEFLNTVYERFFQGFSVKQADTHGIVYTPQEIVDFMVESVDEVLQREFGKSIETPGVKILDPATGTGNFIVNIIRRIDEFSLEKKYKNDLFCNEIMLLPYYISSLNIEHEYYAKMGQYEPFEGICFADTLELAEGKQLTLEMFVEENTERVKREKDADIMVVIGNPPYNAWQKNENDNNKSRPYPIVDERIRETYVKYSKATNRNALSDAYVRFFRWATDRLGDRDGVICFVSNNGFLEGFAFDGFRKKISEEFTHVYHLDLGGNARKRRGGNVFGIMVGVGITILVRKRNISQGSAARISYHKVNDEQSKSQKLSFLRNSRNVFEIDWIELQPDKRYTWLTDDLHAEFETFLPIGSKDEKTARSSISKSIFRAYTNGVKTNRDNWVYDFDKDKLTKKVTDFIDTYNGEIDRWLRANQPEDIDNFVIYDDAKIKWSRDLKSDLKRKRRAHFQPEKIRQSLYRPYTKKFYFFDPILSQDIFLQPKFFPNLVSERENISIWLKVGSEWPMFALATNAIPDLLPQGGSQSFPFYVYSEDGTNRRENITDWALKQFQDKYGPEVTKWDIFHYVYGMLHHPQYRELYKENLKRDLPHIPLLLNQEGFEACVSVGKQLMDLHVNYDNEKIVEEYPLKAVSNPDISLSKRLYIKKMKLSADKTELVMSEGLTLKGIPQECFEYRLGNRSALEWVIDQYQVSTDKRSGIESDPNRLDDPQYIMRLVKQVVTVSVKTVELVKGLTEAVTAEDWLGEQGEEDVEEPA